MTAASRTRYFRRGDDSEPMLFRILPQIKVQTYDVSGHAWRPAPLEPLYRWAVVDPDMSVDEITEQEALALIDRLHRRPSSPG